MNILIALNKIELVINKNKNKKSQQTKVQDQIASQVYFTKKLKNSWNLSLSNYSKYLYVKKCS